MSRRGDYRRHDARKPKMSARPPSQAKLHLPAAPVRVIGSKGKKSEQAGAES